ncbi:MAG: hypothetical protein JXC33_12900 [Deltaproteobacteria bacterium]|nr:hypothetical protein [Deltaproteobacteria bacterium]
MQRMNKKLWCLVVIMVFSTICAPYLNADAKTKIAIVDLDSQGDKAKSQESGKMAAQLLTAAFVQEGRFDVVERQALQKVIEEQQLGVSGLIDANTAVQLGRVIGATFIVTGAVISYPQGMDMVVKILETESATIKFADRLSGGTSAALFKKIPSFVAEIVKQFPIEGLIIQLRGKKVTLDIGEKAGVSKGMQFKVYEEGPFIKHPVTGDILGREKTQIGFITVTEVQEKLSFAKVTKEEPKQKVALSHRVVSLKKAPMKTVDYSVSAASSGIRFERTWGRKGTGTGDFYLPYGIAADAAGIVYVADTYNNRIQMFDVNGTYVRSWGQKGTGQGDLIVPYDVAVDGQGNVYVADTYNFRVQKFDSTGKFILQWGRKGKGNGEFAFLSGIATGPEGRVYTTDAKMHRIQVFDNEGQYLQTWGRPGKDNGSFVVPMGITVDDQGNVYVADSKMRRVQKFDSSGRFLIAITDSRFVYPIDVAVDKNSGNLFVLDGASHNFWEVSPTGGIFRSFGGAGSNNAQFIKPYGLCTDAAGNVFVADSGNSRIQKFGP